MNHAVREGELLWTPRPEFVEQSNMAAFLRWLETECGRSFSGYEELRQWSIRDLDGFWSSIWNYFSILSETPYQRVLNSTAMPGTRWFEGSLVNHAEHLLRHEGDARDDEVAFYHCSEHRPLATMTWRDLGGQVRILATQLRAMGVKPGDRLVSYMPNVPETAIAMMATTAIGAVWSSAAPEFGVKTVIDRFSQIAPKAMFAADGYRFAGREFRRESEVRQIASELPSLEHVVWLPFVQPQAPALDLPGVVLWPRLLDHPNVGREDFHYERVPFDHPLWIVFSSGTTGLPKPIVHSHVGVLVEHLKIMHFHINLKPGAVMFFYSTTGWMMWNILLSALLTGAAAVLYDGSPFHPDPDLLWRLTAETGVTCFGASPTFVQMMERSGLKPGEKHDLSRLESAVVSGAPSTPETFAWFYRCVKPDLWVTSQSGGTELCSAFVGGVPLLRVHAGEIQARLLGMDVHSWSDSGEELDDAIGELVVTKPFPSMPIYFWNDEGDRRYFESYFETFPGVWRHGDFIRINARGGCHIYGRSDSTLNRHGVRIGTAEVYRAIEKIPEIADSLIVCCELPGGNFFMPLFLVLKDEAQLDRDLQRKIAAKLREECSPRHVPDRMYAVTGVPRTLTGKKMEVPVRKILMGWPLDKAASRDAMANPETIDYFVRFAQESLDYQWRSPSPEPASAKRAT